MKKSKRQILAIDVGNTTVAYALFDHKGRCKKNVFLTRCLHGRKNPDIFTSIGRHTIDRIVISSVVPTVHHVLSMMCKKYFEKKPHILNAGAAKSMGFSVRYRPTNTVGPDRLAAAMAARERARPSIVVDFGTGLTFDVIDKKGDYQGGIIFPGMDVAFQTLQERAALLRRLDYRMTARSIVGQSSRQSLASGRFYGYMALVEGLVRRVNHDMGASCAVILTGGDAKALYPHLQLPKKSYDPNLVLKGLYLWACHLSSQG